MHGDAFTTLYSEVPQALSVSHQGVLPVGADTFNVTADEGSIVALTVDGEIIGVAEGTGSEMAMAVTPVPQPGVAKLTVTKANYYRHVEDVPVIYPVTYDITPPRCRSTRRPTSRSRSGTTSVSRSRTSSSRSTAGVSTRSSTRPTRWARRTSGPRALR